MLAVLSLTNKYLFYEERVYEGLSSVNETYIFSAFWTGKEGTIYVEAFDETIVRNVVSGMNVFLSAYRNAFELIPVTDRTQLFDIPQRSKPLPLHAFVRVKKGLYRGDLAQVVRLLDDTQQVVLKLVPRLDLSEFEGGSFSAASVRPEAKLFDPSRFPEGRVSRRNIAKFGGRSAGVASRRAVLRVQGELLPRRAALQGVRGQGRPPRRARQRRGEEVVRRAPRRRPRRPLRRRQRRGGRRGERGGGRGGDPRGRAGREERAAVLQERARADHQRGAEESGGDHRRGGRESAAGASARGAGRRLRDAGARGERGGEGLPRGRPREGPGGEFRGGDGDGADRGRGGRGGVLRGAERLGGPADARVRELSDAERGGEPGTHQRGGVQSVRSGGGRLRGEPMFGLAGLGGE